MADASFMLQCALFYNGSISCEGIVGVSNTALETDKESGKAGEDKEGDIAV